MEKTICMGFGAALSAMKDGHALTRRGWNGSGQFVYFVGPGNYPAKSPVAKAFWGDEALIPYRPYLAIRTVDGTVVPWVATQTDILANDWAFAEPQN